MEFGAADAFIHSLIGMFSTHQHETELSLCRLCHVINKIFYSPVRNIQISTLNGRCGKASRLRLSRQTFQMNHFLTYWCESGQI